MSFCVSIPHFSNNGLLMAEIWHLIDFQNDGRGCSILVLASYLLMSLISEGQCISANQISSTYLNSWPSYNYFHFGKTNVRHIGIPLLVSISVISPQLACHFASGYRISSKSNHLLWKYGVISIFPHGGCGRLILLPVSYLLIQLY